MATQDLQQNTVTQEALDAGVVPITVEPMSKKPGPVSVEVTKAPANELPDRQHGTFIGPEHNHDGIQQPKTLERWIAGRTERIYAKIPGTSAATAVNYGVIFMALNPCFVRAVYEFHETKGTDAGSVGLNVEKLTGTTAPDSGTTILTSNLDLKGNNNTEQQGALVVSRSTRTLAKGDRLCLKDSGTLTAVAGVIVILELEYLQ